MDHKALKSLATTLALACIGSQEGQAGNDMLMDLEPLQSGQGCPCQSSQTSQEILTPQEMLQRVLSNLTHPFSKEDSNEQQSIMEKWSDLHANGFSDIFSDRFSNSGTATR